MNSRISGVYAVLRKQVRLAAGAAILLGAASAGNVHAGTILTDIPVGSGDTLYSYFNPANTAFLSVVNADHAVLQVSSFDNAASFVGVDSVWVNAQLNSNGGALGAAEVTNLTSFISTGHKGVIITDNAGWSAFNATIEQIIGATITDVCDTNTGTASTTNPLGAGVGSVSHGCGSILDPASNAEVIVSAGIASLYSVGLGEVLVITSVDLFRTASPQEPEFIQNISDWLNDPIEVSSVPEPGMLALLGLGIAALHISRRRKAA